MRKEAQRIVYMLERKITPARRKKINREVRAAVDAHLRRHWQLNDRYREDLPVYEVMEGETIDDIFAAMKDTYKYYEAVFLADGTVNITCPVRPERMYAKDNLQMLRHEIVLVGTKPADERPPSTLYQFRVIRKMGRPVGSKNKKKRLIGEHYTVKE